MTEAWRKKFIHEQRGAYRMATIEKIDQEWLIFDAETDEAIPFTAETFQETDIQICCKNQEWHTLQYYNSHYLRADEKLIPIEIPTQIRMETPLAFSYHKWLEQLPRNTLLRFTQFINDLNYSLFDCIYCHNTTLFQSTKRQHVNFIFLDNSCMPCSVYHTPAKNNKDKEAYFSFTLADGKSYQLMI